MVIIHIISTTIRPTEAVKKNSLTRQGISSPSLLISAFAVIVYLILVFILSRPFTGWLFFSKGDEKGLLSAAKFDPENATYHYLLGRFYHLNLQSPDIKKAAEFYSRSLKLNPLQAGVWIDLSKTLHQTEGKTEEAEYALERALKLSPRNTELMWETGTSWLIHGNTEKAVSVLRQYLLFRPDKHIAVYDLCYKLGLTNNYLLEKLVPGSYEFRAKYLTYLMRTKRVDEAVEVWNSLDQQKIEKDIFISYVNFLIRNSMYEQATSVWKEITPKIAGLEGTDETFQLWNPGFENEMLNGGFDWTINETEGVDVYIDDIIHITGNRSLGVTFDGKHNPGIAIARQVVMVMPSSQYKLRSYIKTEGLTTRNGMLMNVQGYNCKGLGKNSEVVTGTTFWREVTIDFKAPPQCNAVLISFIRKKSSKFDNKIEGTAWIDGIKLKQVTNLPKIISKKP